MNTNRTAPASSPPAAGPVPFREAMTDALRYWEPRRAGYNLFLAAIVMASVGVTWPHFRGAFTWPSALALLVLAVLANVCYCAAYALDIPIQFSALRDTWRMRRWLLWTLGSIFAGALTCYWITDEIYPAVS